MDVGSPVSEHVSCESLGNACPAAAPQIVPRASGKTGSKGSAVPCRNAVERSRGRNEDDGASYEIKEQHQKSLTWQKAVHATIAGADKNTTNVFDVFSKLKRHVLAKEKAKELLKTEPSFSLTTVRAACDVSNADKEARESAEMALHQNIRSKGGRQGARAKARKSAGDVDVKADLRALKVLRSQKSAGSATPLISHLFSRLWSRESPGKANQPRAHDMEDDGKRTLKFDDLGGSETKGDAAPLDTQPADTGNSANSPPCTSRPDRVKRADSHLPTAPAAASRCSPGSTSAASPGSSPAQRRAALEATNGASTSDIDGAQEPTLSCYLINGQEVPIKEVFHRYDTSNQGHLTKSQLLCLLMDLRLLGNAHTCDVMEAMFTEADESFQGRVTQELFEACSHRFISMQLHTRLRRHTSLSDSHDAPFRDLLPTVSEHPMEKEMGKSADRAQDDVEAATSRRTSTSDDASTSTSTTSEHQMNRKLSLLLQSQSPIREASTSARLEKNSSSKSVVEDHKDEVMDTVTLDAGLMAAFRDACATSKPGTLAPLCDLSMNGTQFARMCHGSRLVGGVTTVVMMDLIFAKAKGRTAGLTFNRFLYTLAMIAQSKQTTYLSVCRKLVLNSMMHVMEKHEKTAMTRASSSSHQRVAPAMARQAFKLYDRSGTGEITVEGIAAFLTDLGVFGDDPAEVAKSKEEVRQHFQMADKNNDGRIAFDEFLIMYNRILNNDAMANKLDTFAPVAIPESDSTDAPLMVLFESYSQSAAGRRSVGSTPCSSRPVSRRVSPHRHRSQEEADAAAPSTRRASTRRRARASRSPARNHTNVQCGKQPFPLVPSASVFADPESFSYAYSADVSSPGAESAVFVPAAAEPSPTSGGRNGER